MLELNPYQRPRLRYLDVRPFSQQGQSYLLISDPLQLTDKQLVVPQLLAPALAYCDGHNEISDICALFQKKSGIPLRPDQLSEMLTSLDNAYMLENDRFLSMQSEARRLFRKASFRPPSLAGRAYPMEPAALRTLFDDYLAAVTQSTDSENDTQRREISKTNGAKPKSPVRGLLSPHIDYQRGGDVYAQVWKESASAALEADLVIIIGTDHNGSDPFTLTQQNYATPYGTLPTSNEIVDSIAQTVDDLIESPRSTVWEQSSAEYASAAYAGELRHRSEHSLELVLTWLHHMRNGTPCEVVPILVGGFHHLIQNGQSPTDDPILSGVLDKLTQIAQSHIDQGKNVLVVASGDLAHVGPAFSGRALNPTSRKQLLADDTQLIAQMEAGDQAGFFEEIRRVRDGNNVCGVSPIYLTMALLENLYGPMKGTLTGYQVCPADNVDTSVVTVGGIVFC